MQMQWRLVVSISCRFRIAERESSSWVVVDSERSADVFFRGAHLAGGFFVCLITETCSFDRFAKGLKRARYSSCSELVFSFNHKLWILCTTCSHGLRSVLLNQPGILILQVT